jgi:PIN domain nuclease of toxin-antitoxin system
VAIGSRSGVTVLDASALLALINNEQVSDVVAAFIVDYSVGAAKLAEVVWQAPPPALKELLNFGSKPDCRRV